MAGCQDSGERQVCAGKNTSHAALRFCYGYGHTTWQPTLRTHNLDYLIFKKNNADVPGRNLNGKTGVLILNVIFQEK